MLVIIGGSREYHIANEEVWHSLFKRVNPDGGYTCVARISGAWLNIAGGSSSKRRLVSQN